MECRFKKNQFVTLLLGIVLLLILILYYYPMIYLVSQKIFKKYIVKKSIYSLLQNKQRVNIIFFAKDFDSKTETLLHIYLASYEPVSQQLGIVYIPPNTKFLSLSKSEYTDIKNMHEKKGINFLREKLEEYLNISIPYYISFKKNSFQKLLNLIGGIEINILFPIKKIDKKNNKFYLLKPGKQLLFASKIIEYITYAGGENKEIDSIYRQQKFFKALIERLNKGDKILTSNKALDLLYTYLDEYNIQKTDLIEIVKMLYSLRHYNILMAKLPGEITKHDKYEFLTPDVLKISNVLPQPYKERVENDEVDDRIIVKILNSTKVIGLAGKLRAKFLEYYDIDVVELSNYSKPNNFTIIKDNRNNFRSAQRIREVLTTGKIISKKNEKALVDIEIIIGNDYKDYIK